MLDKLKKLGCIMNIKINHLDYFPDNLSDVNEEHYDQFYPCI